MTAQTMTLAKLIENTEKVANELLKSPNCKPYADCIRRKVDALKSIPTAANAVRVLEDLKMIAETTK